MSENIVVEKVGGPEEGRHLVKVGAWPPPEEIPADLMGRYVRQCYSNLPDNPHPNVIRGAVYQYVPREEN